MKKILTISTILILMLSACSSSTDAFSEDQSIPTVISLSENTEEEHLATTVEQIDVDFEEVELSSDNLDLEEATIVELSDEGIAVDGPGAFAEGSILTINTAGTYLLSGSLSDGQVIVNSTSEENVILYLNGINIKSHSSAPIYVMDAEKVILTLAEGSRSIITDSAEYNLAEGEDEPNAAIFSKDDLTINGEGELIVNASGNNGIASKDDLKITSGTITVTAVNDGLNGKDSVVIKDGSVVINAGADGIQTTNTEEAENGFILIEGGSLHITAGLDGIQAETNLLISGGNINIFTANEKGLVANTDLTIEEGTININAADDAVHSNGSMTINGSSLTLVSSDDGMHADGTLVINDGTIDIQQSFEGIEATDVTVNGGVITIISTDDGINGAGGIDTTNGQQDSFGGEIGSITINGGMLTITPASSGAGDALDSNGSLSINGGEIIIYPPATYRDYSNLDASGTFSLTGGSVGTIDTSGNYTELTSADGMMMGGGPGRKGGKP